MTAPSRFKQSDVTRALRAATAAGLKPSGYKIDSLGAIIVMFSDDLAPKISNNPWDVELAS